MPPQDEVLKRERIVKGSCWACKQRRVKCDLKKPKCRRCASSGTTCNYEKLLIRWGTSAVKGVPTSNRFLICSTLDTWEGTLATNERRALDYFNRRLWPLLSVDRQPCTPPRFLAMQSRTVLSTVCLLADAHLRLLDKRNSDKNLQQSRLHCLATIRRDLSANALTESSLSSLSVAILLRYFLDGFVESGQPSASTESHHAGVQAVIKSFGGFGSITNKGHEDLNMLLSEFASTDLTSALLHERMPWGFY